MPRLTTSQCVIEWLSSWSPDSKKLTFESDRDGNFEIYVVNADGSEPKRLTSNPAWDGNPQWSPKPYENGAIK